jgi:hypothetical protein
MSAPVRARSGRRCARSRSSGVCPRTAILRIYLRLAPFGGNLEGVRAASLAYFGKEPKRLSLAEAALLVRAAAVAGDAPADRYTAGGAARAQPRARPRGGGWRDQRQRCRARQGRSHAVGTARVPHAGAAPGRRRGRAEQDASRASPDAGRAGANEPRAAGARSTRPAWVGTCPRLCWSWTIRRAR